MKSWQRSNLITAEKDKEELLAEGFIVEEKTPWHWRISKEDCETTIDVWPSKGKYWIHNTNYVQFYTNLFKLIKEKLCT